MPNDDLPNGEQTTGQIHSSPFEAPLPEDDSEYINICPPVDPTPQGSTADQILALLKGIKIGSDLTKVAVPPIFNIPKSQLQLFTEATARSGYDYLSDTADGKTEIDRFLAVLKWHISTTREATFGKSPYNPILGETHHLSIGNLNVLMEQVSHHPPISALRAQNEAKNIVVTFWAKPTPKYYGPWLEAELVGRKILSLTTYSEDYICTAPHVSFRFLPVPGTEWVGTTKVTCEKSGFEAVLEYKAKPFCGLSGQSGVVQGKVRDKDKNVLFELSGQWDKSVNIKDCRSGESLVFYELSKTLLGMEVPIVEKPKELKATESFLVWSKVTKALMAQDFEVALQEKSKVENDQRALRKKRTESGFVWEPIYFEFDGANWIWKDESMAVPPAPVVARN